jgi:hypothetical protein
MNLATSNTQLRQYTTRVITEPNNTIIQHKGPILPIKNDRSNPEPREITEKERKTSAWRTIRKAKREVRAVGHKYKLKNEEKKREAWRHSMAGPRDEKDMKDQQKQF